ncbi:acyl carrier protein [Candidatus Desantisbacteria bacterium CG_4_10_14_0_8_um_filter_48_22]|uniref:Acyl carrier protein n=1 Tax=Candidatus Desantisbacteria bacterium CG_4_10_14_0_8_um_filter_48_22 TaxID=1974543 RepID=A0A2M7SEC7_9BACT|nr:MAG: acyl carrier protein [Candidatus Desantisbacteria bacterium CG1_02_49_89]PIV55724.1 MAG: acyl carrier protein [Candidatus Desantisbacteria bacterium CG02_land_8_20_14_3_00_49_13]PIZ17868.1 MAG: acyl carrier protein [Candidatus Desantisbacteria bacterium CG_4_10_14_0_8_um_filter_48_22]PJB27806.1 MAG: acyl carrier protein [Candidatus Desantisbacteria bacterium CG_4_9_14_3_um_filter_50_7]
MEGSVEERVKKVVSKQLKVQPEKIKNESDFVKDLGAESIQSLELVAAFEQEFDITMDEEAALDVKTVGKAIDFIQNLLK